MSGKWDWKLKGVDGHVTTVTRAAYGLVDQDHLIAWFLLAPQPWSFRSRSDKEDLIRNYATQLAELTGRSVYGRVTSRPYSVQGWAQAVWDNATAPTKGAAVMLARSQEYMRSRSRSDKLVYLGVDIGTRSRMVGRVGRVVPQVAQNSAEELAERLSKVEQVMTGRGIEAVPAVGNDMAWLLARSFALGCPVPGQEHVEEHSWDESELAEFTHSVDWSAQPLAQSVKIQSVMGVQKVTRHVVVLTVAQMADISVPESHSPWIAKSDLEDFPVEWSFRVEVRDPEDTSKEMLKLTDRIRSQIRHYTDDHGMEPPRQLERQDERASEVEDEMRASFDGLSTRTRGWYRVAVSAPTEKEALRRAQRLIDLYKPQIKLVREFDQFRLAREFVPGEPLANRSHVRRLPVLKVAAGLPAVTAQVGQHNGVVIGESAGLSAAFVAWDPWFLPEHGRSGLTPLITTLGGGKTFLAGLIIYQTCLLGAPWTVMDPTGRLANLALLPELRGLSRVVRVLHSEAGSMCPYSLVPEPRREWFLDEDDPDRALVSARRSARTQRRRLTFDTLRWCLPGEDLGDRAMLRALREAIEYESALSGSSAVSVVERLERMDDEVAGLVARRLRAAMEGDISRLFFSTPILRTTPEEERAKRLTIYSFQGLPQVNDKLPVAEWGSDELLAKPLMNLVAWATLRSVYAADKNSRKGIFIDELPEFANSASFASLLQKISTDSRKWDIAALVAAQNASAVTGQDINNFIGAAFVGRTGDLAAQEANCDLLGLPRGAGYEQQFGRLSSQPVGQLDADLPREFVFRDAMGGQDGRGGIEKIRVIADHYPELVEALGTTAKPKTGLQLVKNDPTDTGMEGVA